MFVYFSDGADEEDSQCSYAPDSDVSTRASTPTNEGVASSSKTPMPPPKPKKKRTEKMSDFESFFLQLAKTQSSRIEEERQQQRQRHALDAFFREF